MFPYLSKPLSTIATNTTTDTHSTMPTSIDHQFSGLSLNQEAAPTSKDNVLPPTSSALVSPTKSELGDTSLLGNDDSFDSSAADENVVITAPTLKKTEHKILEEQGAFKEEPLLKENPHRFVIFPIEDNDVSYLWYHTCFFESLMRLSCLKTQSNTL